MSGVFELPRWVAMFALAVGVLWSINLFNFMDGIDGIAGSQAAFVSAATALLIAALRDASSPWLLLPVVTAGACFGFLAWNWPPARIFMGDVGSGFFGLLPSSRSAPARAHGYLELLDVNDTGLGVIADATVTLVRRIVRRERWHEAHRSHAYQTLAKRWNSHRRVTILLWALNVAIALPLAAISEMEPGIAPRIALATLAGFGLLALLAGAGDGEKVTAA